MHLHSVPICRCIGDGLAVIDLDEPRFTMKAVAEAVAGKARVNTLQSMFQRKQFKLGAADVKAEPGMAHGISLRTALQVGIAWHLYDGADVHPAKGAEIAREFTHFSVGDRDPGELFPKDYTVLIAYPKLTIGRVINCKVETPLIDAFQAKQYGRQYIAVPVWVNYIDRDLRIALLQGGKGSLNI
jgi:hypothetical protein